MRLKQILKKYLNASPILDERSYQLGGTLSGGQQQMLAIGRALMARPKLLLLDEPSMGLAPLVVNEIFETIKEISAEGTTVLLVEQNVRQALKIADYAYVLETGKMVLSGPADEVRHDPRVMELIWRSCRIKLNTIIWMYISIIKRIYTSIFFCKLLNIEIFY